MGVLACIDTVVDIVEVIVDDVRATETNRRCARVDVIPVVVVIGDGDCLVLAAVAVAVANERALPMVVETTVRNGDPSATVGDINKAVVAEECCSVIANAE